jgi:C-3',4' desaturase CrtD
VPWTFTTVGQALRQLGLGQDRRLRTFLDLQLKLYSQCNAEENALLYAATALSVAQAPQGLWHLEGSMQVLSDRLVAALERDGGQLQMRHRVEAIACSQGRATGLRVRDLRGDSVTTVEADHIVANVTTQDLLRLLGDEVERSPALRGYRRRVASLPRPSGAFVVYLGVDGAAIPADCPPHLQWLDDPDGPQGENNSLFISVSRPGDGRAPAGQATIIASSFTDADTWAETDDYTARKQAYTEQAIARLGRFFDLRPEHLLHVEAATPRSFETWSGRERGIVGGVGMRLSSFGPFGFANRTPVPGLWLVGDSTHPGEGTAGVSYSALTVVRQIEAELRG